MSNPEPRRPLEQFLKNAQRRLLLATDTRQLSSKLQTTRCLKLLLVSLQLTVSSKGSKGSRHSTCTTYMIAEANS